MKSFFLPLIVFLALAFVFQVLVPWWILAVLGFLIGAYMCDKPLNSFAIGFLGGFILWFSTYLYIDSASNQILSPKIAILLGVKAPMLIFVIASLVIALYTGFAFLSGFYFKKFIK